MKLSKYQFITSFIAICVICSFLMLPMLIGCSGRKPPPPPPPPERVLLLGRTVEKIEGRSQAIANVEVSYADFVRRSDADGFFRLNPKPTDSNLVKFIRNGYEIHHETLPAGWRSRPQVQLGQVVLTKEQAPEQDWDFVSTKLTGWYDFSMPWFYREKRLGILDDITAHGANAIVLNVFRSWGLEYHDGGCPDGPKGDGWYERLLEGGWDAKQFGHNTFEAPFMNIHESQEVNVRWLDLMDSQIQDAEDRGLWVVVSLHCPYDYKWFNHPWWYWGDCALSPFVDEDRFATDWQKIYVTALLQKIKHHPNVIITDNWEEGGFFGSVNYKWKKMMFDHVQATMPNVPYYVYVGDDLADRARVVNWINNEPRIAGLHGHYNLSDDHAYYGLAPTKRLLATEEMALSLENVVQGLGWIDAAPNRDVVMYVGEYRDFMNPPGTGLPDGRVDDRAFWYVRIGNWFNNQ